MTGSATIVECAGCGAAFAKSNVAIRKAAKAGRAHCCSLKCSALSRAKGGADVAGRMMANTRVDGECILWAGRLGPTGYGVATVGGSSIRAHRAAYESAFGAIPNGLVIDHLCRNRACVNPLHLEAVTVGENVRRGDGPSAQNTRKVHCVRGHSLSGENLSFGTRGQRLCRACRKIRDAKYWVRKQSNLLAAPASTARDPSAFAGASKGQGSDHD